MIFALLIATALLPASAGAVGSIETFDGTGSFTFHELDPNSDIVKKQGLEVTKRALRESSFGNAQEKAVRNALLAALASVLARLEPPQRAAIDAYRSRFDRWADSGVLSTLAIRYPTEIIKSVAVRTREIDEASRTATVTVRVEVYAAQMHRRVAEQAELLDDEGKPSLLIVAQESLHGVVKAEALESTLVSTCKGLGYPSAGSVNAAFQERQKPGLVWDRVQQRPAVITDAIIAAGADVALVGLLTLEESRVLEAGGLFGDALAGQTNVLVKVDLIAVAFDGRVLSQQTLEERETNRTEAVAVREAVRRWSRRPPAPIEELLRAIKGVRSPHPRPETGVIESGSVNAEEQKAMREFQESEEVKAFMKQAEELQKRRQRRQKKR